VPDGKLTISAVFYPDKKRLPRHEMPAALKKAALQATMALLLPSIDHNERCKI